MDLRYFNRSFLLSPKYEKSCPFLSSIIQFCPNVKVENKIRHLINFLSEGEGKKFPSIKKELENLENKKKVLEFDLEGVRLAIQKKGQEKFEAKIVLDTLKDFTQKIDQIEPADRPHLFQYLIKSISYGKEEIGVDIF
jgi:hypothetical protein